MLSLRAEAAPKILAARAAALRQKAHDTVDEFVANRGKPTPKAAPKVKGKAAISAKPRGKVRAATAAK